MFYHIQEVPSSPSKSPLENGRAVGDTGIQITDLNFSDKAEHHDQSQEKQQGGLKLNGFIPHFVKRQRAGNRRSVDIHHRDSVGSQMAQDKKATAKEWQDVSNVLDRIFLIMYISILVITTLSFLLQAIVQ